MEKYQTISDELVETATVIWFKQEKFFGFAKVDGSKEEIFFHLNNNFNVQVTEEGTFWGAACLDVPFRGDRIVFVRVHGKKGKFKASPWTYLKRLEKAQYEFGQDQPCKNCEHLMKDHNGNESVAECTKCDCGHPWEQEVFNQPLTSHIDPSGSGDPNGRNYKVVRPGEIPEKDQRGDFYDNK